MIDKDNVKYPPVEHAWRVFRRDRLDRLRERVASTRWAGMAPGIDPLRLMVYALQPQLTRAEAWRWTLHGDDRPEEDTSAYIMAFCEALEAMALVVYAEDKRIYRPDSALVESLVDVDVKPETPMSLFHALAGKSIAFELPRKTQIGIFRAREFLVTAFDVEYENREQGPRSLALLANFGPLVGFRPIAVLDLRDKFVMGPTMSFSEAPPIEFVQGVPTRDEAKNICADLADAYTKPTQRLVHLLLNLVLYMLGSDDLTTLVRAQRRNVSNKNPKEALRILELQDAHVFGVGAKWGRAVQGWMAEINRADAESGNGRGATGRTVSPHIRAAHAHLYWTGPGRAVPTIKFLLPVPVKGGVKDGDDDPLPTIHAMH